MRIGLKDLCKGGQNIGKTYWLLDDCAVLMDEKSHGGWPWLFQVIYL
jgi:hypothetical protein